MKHVFLLLLSSSSHGYPFQLVRDPFQCIVLDGAKVLLGAAGKEMKPQAKLGKCYHAKRARGSPGKKIKQEFRINNTSKAYLPNLVATLTMLF